MTEISIAAETIFSFVGFPVTNTLLLGWLTTAIIATFVLFFPRRPALVPSGIQNAFEWFIEHALVMMEGAFGNRAKAEKYFPFIATIFIVILASNWMGIFPFLGTIGFFEMPSAHEAGAVFVPLFRSAASDLNFTLALAIISLGATHIFGIFAIGFFTHAQTYVSLKGPVQFFIGILEIIAEIAKMISFSFRLFGNIFAGEVLLLIIGVLVPLIIPMPFWVLKFFVGLIQAFIFAILTTVFISTATSNH